MLIARSLSTLHHDTAPIHVCLPPRRTWPAVVFLMPTWAILKGFVYCLPYPKICLMPEMFAHISLTMYIGSVFISCIVSTIFAKRNIHLRKYTPCFSEINSDFSENPAFESGLSFSRQITIFVNS